MDALFDVGWESAFKIDTPLLEMFIRGTIVYLLMFALLRGVFKREAGGVGITDILVIVLIADAAQNAMADDYHSITDGIVLVGSIVFWSYSLDWIGYHVPSLGRYVHPAPLVLVKNGQVIRRNLAHELLTMDEFMGHLREQGIDDVKRVKSAYMEANGVISVVPMDSR